MRHQLVLLIDYSVLQAEGNGHRKGSSECRSQVETRVEQLLSHESSISAVYWGEGEHFSSFIGYRSSLYLPERMGITDQVVNSRG